MLSMLRSGFSFMGVFSYLISAFTVVFLTLPIHEFAHGFVASRLGDPTPRYEGRLTLNPFAHIDYIGALCILLFGFGWAKPVGVNPRYFKNGKRGMALVALAGPLSNLIMATLALLLGNVAAVVYYSISSDNSVLAFLYLICSYIAQINVSLAVFNLIPIPPLDGSKILFSFLPSKYYFKIMQYERYVFIVLMVLLWFDVLNISGLVNVVMNLLEWITKLPFGSILG